MISDIETTDIKASYTVSRFIWILLDKIFEGDDEEDALSFSDKELLDDILRFGTLAEVARRKGMTYNMIRKKTASALSRLEKKIKWIEIKEHQIRHELANAKIILNERDEKVKELELKIIEMKAHLHLAQAAISREKNKQTQREDDHQQEMLKMEYIKNDRISLAKEVVNLHVINQNNQEELEKISAELRKEKKANAKLQREKEAKDSALQKALQNQHERASERETKLKNRIESLENLIEWYKQNGVSALAEFEKEEINNSCTKLQS
jgi:chromosome segregation ATPase